MLAKETYDLNKGNLQSYILYTLPSTDAWKWNL